MQRLGRQAIVSCASYVRAKVDKLFTAGMSMTTTNIIPVQGSAFTNQGKWQPMVRSQRIRQCVVSPQSAG